MISERLAAARSAGENDPAKARASNAPENSRWRSRVDVDGNGFMILASSF
jgi:hypothetical protein